MASGGHLTVPLNEYPWVCPVGGDERRDTDITQEMSVLLKEGEAGRRVRLVLGGVPAYDNGPRIGGLNPKAARPPGGLKFTGAHQGAHNHADR